VIRFIFSAGKKVLPSCVRQGNFTAIKLPGFLFWHSFGRHISSLRDTG